MKIVLGTQPYRKNFPAVNCMLSKVMVFGDALIRWLKGMQTVSMDVKKMTRSATPKCVAMNREMEIEMAMARTKTSLGFILKPAYPTDGHPFGGLGVMEAIIDTHSARTLAENTREWGRRTLV